jgi:hypothetical protein
VGSRLRSLAGVGEDVVDGDVYGDGLQADVIVQIGDAECRCTSIS